jgi:hypothetical protein
MIEGMIFDHAELENQPGESKSAALPPLSHL